MDMAFSSDLQFPVHLCVAGDLCAAGRAGAERVSCRRALPALGLSRNSLPQQDRFHHSKVLLALHPGWGSRGTAGQAGCTPKHPQVGNFAAGRGKQVEFHCLGLVLAPDQSRQQIKLGGVVQRSE